MGGTHPYVDLPDRNYWSRAVSRGWRPESIVAGGPILRRADTIVSAGSCFAANIVPHIEKAGFNYLRTEQLVSLNGDDDTRRFGYSDYSAAYGNIYTSRQLLQLLRRCRGLFKPSEDCWEIDGAFVDPYRPGLPYPAESREEFDISLSVHLAKVRQAFEQASVFIFTLGLTECWTSVDDGAVFPACPGTVTGEFSSTRHRFVNLSLREVTSDLEAFARELSEINARCRIILTVSPVPLVATMSSEHVLTASTYSKSVLRVACSEIEQKNPNVMYFPAYELITGPQAQYYEADCRNVSQAGIDAVVGVLLAHSEAGGEPRSLPAKKAIDAVSLSKSLAARECEEMMQDKPERKPL